MKFNNESDSNIENYIQSQFPDEYISLSGFDQIQVEWINQGDSFVIDEYDGSESVILKDNMNWHKA